MRRMAGLVMAVFLAMGAVGVAPVHAAPPVASDWIYNATTRHFYAEVVGVTWADAEAYARTLSGHLVTVENQAENDWLQAQFPEPWLWIGLNDSDQDGVWAWSSGRKVTFTNWRDGAPDNWKGFDPLGETAATLSSDLGPFWEDISGRWLGQGIVEVQVKPREAPRNQVPTGTHDGTIDEWAVGDACNANGWAWDPDSAKRDVTVRILAQRLDIVTVPREVWRGTAAEFRDDLLANGISDGTAAFTVDLRPLVEWFLPYQITVQGQDLQTGVWVNLDETPRTLTCAP